MIHPTHIVHANVQQKLAEQFRNVKLVTGYTFSYVEEYGV